MSAIGARLSVLHLLLCAYPCAALWRTVRIRQRQAALALPTHQWRPHGQETAKIRHPQEKRQKSETEKKKGKAQFASTVKNSAQQIWLAGLGAFSKAQQEGGKVFEALVKEG